MRRQTYQYIFFQAEDGIRDVAVTGVQTCALPISLSHGWRYLVGGWQLSGILTAETGQPYSRMVSSDLNLDGNSRTDRAPGLGRDTFYLPNFVSLDPRVTKSISLTERVKAQLI